MRRNIKLFLSLDELKIDILCINEWSSVKFRWDARISKFRKFSTLKLKLGKIFRVEFWNSWWNSKNGSISFRNFLYMIIRMKSLCKFQESASLKYTHNARNSCTQNVPIMILNLQRSGSKLMISSIVFKSGILNIMILSGY